MLRRDAGQILPGLLMLLLAILALGVLAFQIGKAAVLRSGAQTAADAAALAGARNIRDQLIQQVLTTGTSDFARTNRLAVHAAAADYARRNDAVLRDLDIQGADVRATVDTEETIDASEDERKGRARARARVELLAPPAALGGGNIGPGPGSGDTTISDKEWKEFGKTITEPPGCPDIVKLGAFLREHGALIIENKALGDNPLPGDHAAGGWHYRCDNSGALDVNYDHTGNEKGIIDALIDPVQKLGFRTIWQTADHFDHAHFDIANTPSIFGGAAGAAGPLADTILQVKLVDWDAPSPMGFAANFVGGPGGIPFGPPDPQVAAIMCGVLDRMNVSDKVRMAAWEAAIVESGVKNLRWGDRDSQGVFQQRPSQGWGTVAQVTDVEYATATFVRRGRAIEGGYSDPGALAQAVQSSDHPERYAQRAGQAVALERKFCG